MRYYSVLTLDGALSFKTSRSRVPRSNPDDASFLIKVFAELFSKSSWGGGATPPINGVFFLIAFSFAPLVSKEKAGEESC